MNVEKKKEMQLIEHPEPQDQEYSLALALYDAGTEVDPDVLEKRRREVCRVSWLVVPVIV